MRVKHLVALIAAAAMVGATPAYAGNGPAQPERATATPATAGSAERVTAAKAALAQVQAIFSSSPTGRARGRPGTPPTSARRDATLALRDLAVRLDDLSPADRRIAEQYLLRPTDPDGDPPYAESYQHTAKTLCGTHFCVHYIDKADHPADEDATDTAWAQTSLDVAEHVWDRIVTQAGYRAPLSDLDSGDTADENGGDGRLDIYLAEEFENGLYGYCMSDDPSRGFDLTVSAYCVVDNDFAEFPAHTPLQNLQVTVAHEFFHAVQFAYEWTEDFWFMEGTAAWIEDEVYDDINDNMFYLRRSWPGNPITHPGVPLDRFDRAYPNYGAWAFWKRLGERYRAQQGTGMPVIVREIWSRAARPEVYSTRALSRALVARGNTFGRFFTAWGVGNRLPNQSYDEGRANRYPQAPLSDRFWLSRGKRSVRWQRTHLNHMTNAFVRLTPNRSLSGRAWRIRVTVDGAERYRGTHATLSVHKRGGAVAHRQIWLNRHGNGDRVVPFGRGNVRYVELTATNASNRFRDCGGFSSISCGGVAKDNRLRFAFKAHVFRR